jgi:CRISPR type III-B/RAMP module RAMP protein Cmr6
MPIYMPNDTAQALGAEADQCQSRSLFFDRFAAPDAKDEKRKTWFDRVVEKKADKTHLRSWGNFLNQVGQPTNLLYAQLQARLMVNMAGGAMENAGLCLDRFGMPYIPGSAVKGCARRAALAALHDWPQANQKPGADHPLASACTSFKQPKDMLAAAALIFGWAEQDWAENGNKSDFIWACTNEETRSKAAQTLARTFGWPIKDKNRETPWKDLPNFAGLISFLPAYPVDLEKTGQVNGLPCKVPNPGDLELDVVTCHHQDYYSSTDPNAVATDTQDPIPVIFPAVAPGHIFVFALLPMDRAHVKGAEVQIEQTQLNLRDIAKTWLATGLSVFGLGAKTNAGYGWFDVSDSVQKVVPETLQAAEERRRQKEQRRQEEARRKAEEEERQRRAAEEKAAMANMTPEQQADYKIAQLTNDQFRSWLESFYKREPEQQKAIVRALRLPPDQPNSRRHFWDDLKAKAKKGGNPARIENAIRELSKKMFPGNEGKMP